MTTMEMLRRAKEIAPYLGLSSDEARQDALLLMADALEKHSEDILKANAADEERGKGIISEVMLDRLRLTPARISAMAEGLRSVAALPDPLGVVLEESERPNGLYLQKVSVPLGVIAIIYESRPNVTADAAALTIRSGNACVLRSGKEAWESAHAIVEAMREGLEASGIDADAVQLVEDTSRQSATELMTAVGLVDLLIPRGGAGLIRACVENARVPCVQTGTGICHIYVDKAADIEKALAIVENAKTSRPSVCNAAEVCLVHSEIAPVFLTRLKKLLVDDRIAAGKTPVELRLDEKSASFISGKPAGEKDFDTEFLDYILAVGVVSGVREAVEHIAAHSTGHSEAIVTEDPTAARVFAMRVDSAAVYINASTRFTDGGEFGLGCEMGISTQKLHARGPMGLHELTGYKYVVTGNGQIR